MNLRRVLIPGCDTGAAILDKVALVCFGIVLLASGEARAETLVGALPGEFAVDNKGAANYSVPISVVPGRGGFQPTLSLAYNSLQGNGVAGVGWSLSYGASKITRGRTIMARDGYVDGMDFDDADRLYLDGKRLIQTNAGSYWHVGAEYRTEVESFVRVTALGANGATNGAGAIEGFKVESKDGSILYFGKVDSSSSDALHILKGNSSPYGWAIKYLQNSVGDRITYFYNPYRDGAGELTGEHQLARIEYSSNAFLAGR